MLLLQALGESLSLPVPVTGSSSSWGCPLLVAEPLGSVPPSSRDSPHRLSGLGFLYADASHAGFRAHPVPVWDLLLA